MALTKAKLIELIGNGDIEVGISNPMPDDTLIVNLNADKLDGYDASNATASIPISNGTVNTNLNADKLDGYHASDLMVGHPNILHNWDFRSPINQRGVSGTISTGTYFYDRWLRNSGSVTVAARYLKIASGAVIEQRIEGLNFAGETVTITVKVGTSYISGSGAFPTSAGTESITLTGFGTADLGYHADYMFVRLTTDAARNLVMVKGELGSISTLAYDPPMGYAIEAPKCRRFYYQDRSSIIQHMPTTLCAVGLANCIGSINFGMSMRVRPTISVSEIRSNVDGTIGYPTSFSTQHNAEGINAIYAVACSPAWPFVVGGFYTFNLTASADL